MAKPAPTPTCKTLDGFQKISKVEYVSAEGGVQPEGWSKEDVEDLRCTCDAIGVPDGLALSRTEGQGCDPARCTAALCNVECSSACRSGSSCGNQRFRRKKYAKVKARQCPGDKGIGLFSVDQLPAETFVIEYVGEAISLEAYKRRLKNMSAEQLACSYVMMLGGDTIVDSSRKGNITRFINHSCDPNCETQKWNVNGETRVGIFTKRPVAAGEELSFDYQFEHYGGKPTKCECGSAKCRGYLGAETALESVICGLCQRGDDEDSLMICEGCHVEAQHARCAGFAKVPRGEWLCAGCKKARKCTPQKRVHKSAGKQAAPASAPAVSVKVGRAGSTQKTPQRVRPAKRASTPQPQPAPVSTPSNPPPNLGQMTERQQIAALLKMSNEEALNGASAAQPPAARGSTAAVQSPAQYATEQVLSMAAAPPQPSEPEDLSSEDEPLSTRLLRHSRKPAPAPAKDEELDEFDDLALFRKGEAGKRAASGALKGRPGKKLARGGVRSEEDRVVHAEAPDWDDVPLNVLRTRSGLQRTPVV